MEMLKELFMTTMYVCGIVFFITLTVSFIQSVFTSIRKQQLFEETNMLLKQEFAKAIDDIIKLEQEEKQQKKLKKQEDKK